MSNRNPDYQFLSTDTAEITERLVASFEETLGTTLRPASPERLILQWVASVLTQERAQQNVAINQNIPSRAEGDNLDALAELFYAQQRRGAQSASVTMRFYVSEPQTSAILIPAGTRVTDESQTLYWETEEDAYIPAGAEYLDLDVKCQTAGTDGNGWLVGQINTIVDVYDYYSRCANITESDGGADAQTDDELYEAMRLSMDALSTAGARGSYIYHAKQVSSEIADVVAASPTPGIVKIYALMKDGTIASETMKQQILEACSADTVRPLTDQVFAEDPETVQYNIDLTYYVQNGGTTLSGGYDDTVQEAVQSFVDWQSAKMGRDINPSKLISMIMATGIKRVDVREPVFTQLRDGSMPLHGVEDPEQYTIPQIASVVNITLTNGGVEDD